MTIGVRLESLQQQHRALDTKLHQEMLRPAFDDLKIHDIKRQKLRLKDQIAALQALDVRQS